MKLISGWRDVCAWAMLAVALTGCGGGSDKKPEPEVNRQPAGAGQNASPNYLVTDSYTGLGGLNRHQLHLVHPETGAVFKSIPIGEYSRYELAGPLTPAASGRGGTLGDPNVLFFIRQYDNGQRQLFRAPLSGADAGTEARISRMSNVCNILESHIAHVDASIIWLMVDTAGVDNSCDNPEDNQIMFVRSDWDDNTWGQPSPFERERALAWEINSLGNLSWIYGYSERYGRLIGVSAVTGAFVEVANGVTGERVETFSPYPGGGARMLVRVGQTVRVFTWGLGGLGEASLGPVITTLASEHIRFTAADEQGVYFADGLNVRRLNTQGVLSTLFTLPAGGEVQYEGAQTPASLVFVQGPLLGSSPVSSGTGTGGSTSGTAVSDTVLWVVPKAGGTARAVETMQGANANIFVAGVAGAEVVYGMRNGYDEHGGFVTIKRFAANAAALPANVATGVRYLYSMGGHEIDAHGGRPPSHLLWCDVAGLANNCRIDRLRSYKLSNGAVVNIGPASAPADPSTWDLDGDVDQLDSLGRGLFEAWVTDADNNYSPTVWSFKADQAQSLKAVALP